MRLPCILALPVEMVKSDVGMNREKAINCFLERVESLTRLPLVTDDEMEGLFGDEVAAAVAELDRLNREVKACRDCPDRCCLLARCELYLPVFHRCPVHDLRPPVCRLHYCHRFGIDARSLIKEIGDIFFDCLLAAERCGSRKVRLFDSPPLGLAAPSLVAAAAPAVNAVLESKLDPDAGAALIGREAERYRCSFTTVEDSSRTPSPGQSQD